MIIFKGAAYIMALDRNDIVNFLKTKPVQETGKNRDKVFEYRSEIGGNTKTLYIERKSKIERIIIHPCWIGELKSHSIDGVFLLLGKNNDSVYKHSNFSDFSSAPEGGSPFGCTVAIRDVSALERLLVRLEIIVVSEQIGSSGTQAIVETAEAYGPAPEPYQDQEAQAIVDIDEAGPSLAGLPDTERKAIVAARLGQGRFRTALMSAWSGQCALTGIAVPKLLRASHIKPWRDSDNGERLDAENGILLIATLDAAFDAGLISFEDDGLMLFSPWLGSDPCAVLSVPVGCRLTRGPSPRQQAFLRHHRDHVFPHGPLRGKRPGV